MKKIFLTLSIVAFFASFTTAQTTTFRKATDVTTIPQSDTVAGKVWTDSSDLKFQTLKYVGPVKLDSLWRKNDIGKFGFYWIYLPDSQKLAKIESVTKTGVDTFKVKVNQKVVGIANQSIKSVKSNLVAYSYQNDGDSTFTVNGVSIRSKEPFQFPYSFIQGTGTYWQEPVIINATLSTVIIVEKRNNSSQ